MALALPGLLDGLPDADDAALPRCPRCDYALACIPEDRCPECGFGYSLVAVERIEQFIERQLIGEYQAAFRWSAGGLLLAGLPLLLPGVKSPAFGWIVLAALFVPTLIAVVQCLRAIANEWALPRWAWFGPLLGIMLTTGVAVPLLLVLMGVAASGVSGVVLLRSTNIPDVLTGLDSRIGRRLGRWRTAVWVLLGLGILLQISLIAQSR